jgi:signal peptidase II
MDAAPTARARHRGAFTLAAAVVIALDQLTKQLALSGLADGPIDLVGPAQLQLTFNDGAAFSMGGGNTRVIAVIAIVVSAVLVRLGLRADRRAVAVGFGILVGGALGNVVDRALRDGDGFLGGRVVDFVDIASWPVFNLADSALWVGIAVLLIARWGDEDEDGPVEHEVPA